jgi:FRG domain
MITNSTTNPQNGFLHSRLSSFDDFRNFANYFSDDLGFIFRGHARCEWNLETSLDRLIRRINPVQTDLKTTYEFQLRLFVKSIRGRTNAIKDVSSNEDELWALGQHYGLATPLLDWTSSLYVSLFFAFIDPIPAPKGFRTVWALHRDGVIEAMAAYNADLEYYEQFSFIDPLTDHNTRLISQAGAFTRQPLGFDVPSWVQTQFQGSTEAYLFKIDVPDSERLRILRHLRQMNIHSGTLFPDLNGASLDCNETLELMADKRRRLVQANPNNFVSNLFKPTSNGVDGYAKE